MSEVAMGLATQNTVGGPVITSCKAPQKQTRTKLRVMGYYYNIFAFFLFALYLVQFLIGSLLETWGKAK